jgi:hypothetical protein
MMNARGLFVRGFELGAKLAHALHDELLDTNGETKVMRRLDAIFMALDARRPSCLGAVTRPPGHRGARFGGGLFDRIDA